MSAFHQICNPGDSREPLQEAPQARHYCPSAYHADYKGGSRSGRRRLLRTQQQEYQEPEHGGYKYSGYCLPELTAR